jgi:crotonobetainyl-CoA:carnitine CoA-transferase CaiB-like acyl-CoA transferase
VMNRFGLSWEQLHKINPKLIMASLTCFGQDGPYAGRPGYDGMGQAMGGFAVSMGLLMALHYALVLRSGIASAHCTRPSAF